MEIDELPTLTVAWQETLVTICEKVNTCLKHYHKSDEIICKENVCNVYAVKFHFEIQVRECMLEIGVRVSYQAISNQQPKRFKPDLLSN